jgi:hypothetical protein
MQLQFSCEVLRLALILVRLDELIASSKNSEYPFIYDCRWSTAISVSDRQFKT